VRAIAQRKRWRLAEDEFVTATRQRHPIARRRYGGTALFLASDCAMIGRYF
jgi:hypothetical protein